MTRAFLPSNNKKPLILSHFADSTHENFKSSHEVVTIVDFQVILVPSQVVNANPSDSQGRYETTSGVPITRTINSMHNSIRKYFVGNLVTAAPPQYSSAIRLCLRRKSPAWTLVSGDISFVRIFGRVL